MDVLTNINEVIISQSIRLPDLVMYLVIYLLYLNKTEKKKTVDLICQTWVLPHTSLKKHYFTSYDEKTVIYMKSVDFAIKYEAKCSVN